MNTKYDENLCEQLIESQKIVISDFFRKPLYVMNERHKYTFYDVYLEDFIYSLVLGDLNLSNIELMKEVIGFRNIPNTVILIHTEDNRNALKKGPNIEQYVMKMNVIKILNEILTERNLPLLSHSLTNTNRIVLLLHTKHDHNNKETLDFLNEICTTLIKEVRSRTNQEIAIAISKRCKNITKFNFVYNDCVKSLDTILENNKMAIIYTDDFKPSFNRPNLATLEEYYSKLSFFINELDKKRVYKILSEFFNFLLSHGNNAKYIRSEIFNIINYLNAHFVLEGVNNEYLSTESINTIHKSFEYLFLKNIISEVYSFCITIMETIQITENHKEKSIRTLIEECIDKNFADKTFNLNKLSQICNYNSCYFGRMFKELYDTSFNNYLKNTRIEKSKFLLRNSTLSVAEIAEIVGFDNSAYFCTCFKKITNVTPLNYRKRKK